MLDPDGSGCMLPAAAYLDDAVLAWERTHLFAGAWVCAGRAADLSEVGTRRAVTVGDDAVLLVRGDDGRTPRLLQRLPAPRPRAGALRSDGRRPLDPLPVPRLALRTRRHHCCRCRGSMPRTGSTSRSTALVPVAVEEWHGWVMVNASGDARTAVGVPRRPRRTGRRLRARAAGRRRHARVRAGDELEAHRRELPRVLPLPEHPSAAVQRQPADEWRERRRAEGVLGRRLAGSHAPRRHDVAVGRVADGSAARPATASRDDASTTSACCRTCCSACIPTT